MKVSWILATVLSLVLLAGSFAAGLSSTGNWEQIDTIEGVDLFRSLEESDDLLPFKAIARLNIPYQKIVMALVDAENKNTWAPKLKSTAIHNEISTNQFEYSEYYTTPWPFYDREFLLLGTVEYESDRIVFTAQNSVNKELADGDHLLANVKVLEFVVIPLSQDWTQVEFTFSGDLGGWIPEFVKNIIQKKWPIRFILAMQSHIKETPALETVRYLSLQKREPSFPQKAITPGEKRGALRKAFE